MKKWKIVLVLVILAIIAAMFYQIPAEQKESAKITASVDYDGHKVRAAIVNLDGGEARGTFSLRAPGGLTDSGTFRLKPGAREEIDIVPTADGIAHFIVMLENNGGLSPISLTNEMHLPRKKSGVPIVGIVLAFLAIAGLVYVNRKKLFNK